MLPSESFVVLALTFMFILIHLELWIPFYIKLLTFACLLFSILILSISADN